MPEEQLAPQPTVEIDRERFEVHLKEFRELHRFYIDDNKKSLDLATDANKQISAFFERIMFLALGTIGLSITTVTSFASRFSSPGFHKYTTIVALVAGWLLLFASSAASRSVILTTIIANK